MAPLGAQPVAQAAGGKVATVVAGAAVVAVARRWCRRCGRRCRRGVEQLLVCRRHVLGATETGEDDTAVMTSPRNRGERDPDIVRTFEERKRAEPCRLIRNMGRQRWSMGVIDAVGAKGGALVGRGGGRGGSPQRTRTTEGWRRATRASPYVRRLIIGMRILKIEFS